MSVDIALPIGADLVGLAQCHALHASAFPGGAPPFVFAESAPAIWVARLDGEVVGFVAGVRESSVLEITAITVAAAHRGKGLGRALLRAAIDSARDRDLAAVRLHVSTGNGPACDLYVSEGFRASRRLPGFYNPRSFPDDGDAWEMLLRLR